MRKTPRSRYVVFLTPGRERFFESVNCLNGLMDGAIEVVDLRSTTSETRFRTTFPAKPIAGGTEYPCLAAQSGHHVIGRPIESDSREWTISFVAGEAVTLDWANEQPPPFMPGHTAAASKCDQPPSRNTKIALIRIDRFILAIIITWHNSAAKRLS